MHDKKAEFAYSSLEKLQKQSKISKKNKLKQRIIK